MKVLSILAAFALSTVATAAEVDCAAKPVPFSRAQKLALPELKLLQKQGYSLVAVNLSAECPAVVELVSYNRFTHAKATVTVHRDQNGTEVVSAPALTPYY